MAKLMVFFILVVPPAKKRAMDVYTTIMSMVTGWGSSEVVLFVALPVGVAVGEMVGAPVDMS